MKGSLVEDAGALYHFYHEIIGGTVFVDEEGKYVDWRADAGADFDVGPSLEVVASFFKVTIMALPGAYLVPDDPEDEFDQEIASPDDEDISSWCEKNVEMIREAIKQAHIDADDVETEDAEEEEFEETDVVNHVGPVSDAVQEQKEEETMSKKSAAKKTTAKKKSAKAKPSVVVYAPKKTAKAKKPAKKAPVKGSKPAKKPAKGGGKKK